ncbi:MAG: RNA methyltransferase [Anaerolineales bacterium]|nr:MAG: RNA methyltransferase [Anaerolineales bacterium]
MTRLPCRYSVTRWSTMIISIHNPRVQEVRKLLTQAKERREQGAFVVEGVRLTEEALRAGWKARLVLYTARLDERGMHVVHSYASLGLPVEEVSEGVMKSVSETESPQGLMAVLEQKTQPSPPALDYVLILDGMRDPGNLGTILRTSAAAGVQLVLLAPGCVDAWSPKVLRSGMGAHFRLALQSHDWQAIKRMIKSSRHGVRVYLADAAGEVQYTQANFREPLAIIVGGEAAGAGSESAALADEKVYIPMPGGSESLNAAVAAGILLFEVARQRLG